MNTKVLFSKESDHWSTPKTIYDYFMNKRFVDPCPLHCEENNLLKDFGNVNLYINPPYSDINSWVDYSISHVCKYFGAKVYLLVPSRTDTKWFQKLLQSDNLKVTFNFFEGRLTPDGKLKFANNQEITLSKATMDKFDAEKIGNGLDVIMGIRPGDLRLVDSKEKSTTVIAKVELIEALGNETIVYSNLDLNGAETLERSSTSITLSAKLKSNPRRHSEIFLDIDEDCIHLFDKTTEESIRK